MALSLNERLLDLAILRQIGLERYATGLERRVLAVLEAAQVDQAGRLRAHLELLAAQGIRGPAAVERLRGILAELDSRARSAWDAIRLSILLPALAALARAEADHQLAVLRAVVPGRDWLPAPGDPASSLASVTLTDRGLTIEQEIATAAAAQQTRIAGAVQGGAAAGDSPATILRRVAGTSEARYEDGIFQSARRDAVTITGEAVGRAASTAREGVLVVNSSAFSGILLVPVLDARTSAICRSIGTPAFPALQPLVGGRLPPFHGHCRTTGVPVVIRGAIPEEPSFTIWIRRQRVPVQDAILGRRQAQKLRANPRLRVDDRAKLIGKRAYSLEELAGMSELGLG